MRAYLTVHSLLALALFGLASRSAQAQSTCSTDSDCVKGWACEVTGGGACASKPCPPGETCDPQPNDCANFEYKSCVPGPCRADSDCADGMVCYTHTETDCPPVACAPGQECPVPSCAPRTESACVPRYILPCTSASDCGSGFTCESAGEQCECSGSAGGRDPGSDGGTPTPPPSPEESCTCTPSAEQRCRVVPVTCAADSDCSGGWTCVVVASSGDCTSPALPTPTPGSGGGSGAPDSGVPEPNCRPSANVKQCLPPYYAIVSGGRGLDSSSGSDEDDTPTAGTDNGGSAPGNGGVASPAVPSAESGKGDTTSSAGCSVSRGSGGGSALALLGVLGMFGVLRRRRAR